ncbi:proline--tRNA ligase [Paramagnetospirillum magneticum]|uniref:Proline--tRNA ligase n=1 Tax=Paramagnetospirillum magneticum (strain ATCC 700264 / AMB-1) TaxID=342108 RepID=SYP_PARM1|nr:proline--tRNA ligase [Paramagnetospirillum magneticum]Q2W136.2 RecName: Full=Proline--tRNA ligase; AltName: Full=Prolyl-tRNA synthetase; Short=ProRS [Paramagnetospirillum magneticum AMB-1]
MSKAKKTAVTPTREENFPEWYQQVIKASDMAENSPVRGCMVIKPWGYGIWEAIQRDLDRRIKETGHENCYFPLFIPLSFLEKEAAHVEGFAKEMAVVTHHRLVAEDGKLVPSGKLEEPLVVRPTSETIIGDAFARWIQSYRDLPMLVNQWANVVRWEMRPRIFLRTAEFLWQEGHTAHATAEEAMDETLKMLEVYRVMAEEVLAMPVIVGEKPAHERFPGADKTYSIEAMMQDGKALQAGTSHFLGQHFSKAQNIRYQTAQGGEEFCYTTSWGVSTRLIGGVIMSHADDNGLRVPPRIAPKQIVFVPITRADGDEALIEDFLAPIVKDLSAQSFGGERLRVHVDRRPLAPPEKRWEWVKKGAPIICEVGPRDVAGGSVAMIRRDGELKGQITPKDELVSRAAAILEDIQKTLFTQAATALKERTVTVRTLDDFLAVFADDTTFGRKFVRARWCGDSDTLAKLDEYSITIRNVPFDQDGEAGTCVLSGRPATQEVIFAKSY